LLSKFFDTHNGGSLLLSICLTPVAMIVAIGVAPAEVVRRGGEYRSVFLEFQQASQGFHIARYSPASADRPLQKFFYDSVTHRHTKVRVLTAMS